jgi:hypothetical protein
MGLFSNTVKDLTESQEAALGLFQKPLSRFDEFEKRYKKTHGTLGSIRRILR